VLEEIGIRNCHHYGGMAAHSDVRLNATFQVVKLWFFFAMEAVSKKKGVDDGADLEFVGM
jgi:hypothetical protein